MVIRTPFMTEKIDTLSNVYCSFFKSLFKSLYLVVSREHRICSWGNAVSYMFKIIFVLILYKKHQVC